MRHLQVLVKAEILLLKLAMVAVAMLTTSSVYADLPTIVALDNADFSQYAPQPNNNWLRTNGGSGYQPWTWITDPVGPLQRTDEYHLVETNEFLEKAVKALRITRAAILYTILFIFGLESKEEDERVPRDSTGD